MEEKRDAESQDEHMKKVEQGIKDIQEKLRKSDMASTSRSAFGFGFAVLAAALGITLSFNSIKGDVGAIPLVVLIVILILGGYAIMFVSGGMSIPDVPHDATQAKRRSRPAQFVSILWNLRSIVLINLGVVLAFAGSSIRHWSPTAGDWVAVVGLIGFTAGLALMFAATKSSNAAPPPHLRIDP